MLNTVVAFLHLGALLAVLVYAFVSLAQGNASRFGLIILLVGIYYVFLLHPAVVKEIKRRRALKKGPGP